MSMRARPRIMTRFGNLPHRHFAGSIEWFGVEEAK